MNLDDYEVRKAMLYTMYQSDQKREKTLYEQRDNLLEKMAAKREEMLLLVNQLSHIERAIQTKESVTNATRHYLDVLRMAA